MTPDELYEFDRVNLWHPYTSIADPFPTRLAARASGASIELQDGTRLVDGMASWWCAVHGYGHPALKEAARVQLEKMSHVMFGGLTHEPAVAVGKKLLAHAPSGLDRIFYADSGSVAVEVALKMALQYRVARGETGRRKFLALRGGYHGDTLGAMSVTDPVGGMHKLFAGFLPQNLHAERPSCRFGSPFDPESLAPLRDLAERHADELAALILEPIVQGAGGMWFYHPEYLAGARKLCDETGLLLIADEIASGFWRTGKYFACEWAGISPDIMCVGKAFTGGFMTGAAVLATREVAYGVSEGGLPFMHGPTFMANPLTLAVASASLDLLEDPALPARIARMEALLKEGLAPLAGLPGVADVRVLGAMGVVEMDRPVNMRRLTDHFIARGVWLRPFGRLIYAMPPYVASDAEIARLTSAMASSVQEDAW